MYKVYFWSVRISYMKIIGSRSRSLQQKVQNFLFPQCRTSLGNNSGGVKACIQQEVFGYCGLNGVTAILSRDQKYMHSWVVCLRLEGNLVLAFVARIASHLSALLCIFLCIILYFWISIVLDFSFVLVKL